jgi:copper chaperone CopZ
MSMRSLIPRALVLGALAGLPLLSACSDDRAAANASAGATGGASVESSAQAVPAGLVRAEFDVAGMDCGGCVIGTRAALRKLKGVQKADASYDDATGKGTAWALYDPAKVTPERMMAAIRELGYTPTIAKG